MFDAIVLGVGGMGSAAVRHLARRGARVLGIEQFDIPNDRGSSHGNTRILRLPYWEHTAYVPLVVRALDLWKELEVEVSEQLFTRAGSIDAGTPESRHIVGALEACARHSFPHEHLTAAQVNRTFPGYALPPGHVAVYQPDGGFLLAERCTLAHCAAARRHNAEIHVGERVTGWTGEDGVTTVFTDHGEYRSRRLVITAGPWLPVAVPKLSTRLVVERQVMLWTKPLVPEKFAVDRYPVFYLDSPLGAFYGFPLDDEGRFKIGKYHHRRQETTADGVDRQIHPEDESVLRQGIAAYFPDANGPTVLMKTCLFTNTPDEHFIIDRLSNHPEVIVAGGFSGHGYKFCSVVGEIVADLALDGVTRWSIETFALGRFDS